MTLIKTITPKINTLNFPVDGLIDIEFLKAMNPDSLLREDAVYLETNGERVPVEREVKNGKNLSLIPKESLKHGTIYIITFNGYDGGIEDWTKAPLNTKETSDFLTEFVASEDDSQDEETYTDEDEDPIETPPLEEPPVDPNPSIGEEFNEGVVASSIYI